MTQLLVGEGFTHTPGRPYHPMTHAKIERYHRSMNTILLLDNDYGPAELTFQIAAFVEYYNHRRYHELLDNVILANAYHSRAATILREREKSNVKPSIEG